MDLRFTHEGEQRPVGVLLHQRLDLVGSDATGFGHAGHLVLPGSQADVRVQPAGGSGDQINRHRRGVARIGRTQRLDTALDGFCQRWVERPLVGAGGRASVVGHGSSGRGPAPEVFRFAEVLPDQRGAHRFAIAQDEAAGGLSLESACAAPVTASG